MTIKRSDAGISVVIFCKYNRKSGLMAEFRLYAGISPDPEITDKKPA